MPGFKKGHNFGFKAGHVPHNKGMKVENEESLPAPYIRLSGQMYDMILETPSAAVREEMVMRHECYHLLRPRVQTMESPPKSLNDDTSEQ